MYAHDTKYFEGSFRLYQVSKLQLYVSRLSELVQLVGRVLARFRYRKIHGNKYSFSPNFPPTCSTYIFIVFLLFLRRRQKPNQPDTVSYIRYLPQLSSTKFFNSTSRNKILATGSPLSILPFFVFTTTNTLDFYWAEVQPSILPHEYLFLGRDRKIDFLHSNFSSIFLSLRLRGNCNSKIV